MAQPGHSWMHLVLLQLSVIVIPTTGQVRYHGHCGIIVALDSCEP